MRGAFEILVPSDQHFSAPNVPIGPVAGSVEREPNHPAFEMVFRHTTCDVRVVVLYTNHMRIPLLLRPLCGEVVGMEVAGDGPRLNFEDPLEVVDGFVKKAITFDIF